MTKRISQSNSVVVPGVQATGVDGKVVAAKAVVVPAEAEVAAAKAEVKTDEAPEVVAAVAAPAPMAMVAQDTTTTPATTTEPAPATTMSEDGGATTDMTPYIVGGVLLAGGILAIALSSGDDDTPTPTPKPPAPVTTVAISSAQTATVAENAPVTALVLDVNATATATNGGSPGAVTYALSGADASLFTINATNGEIRLNSAANFEAKTSYAITVTVSAAANGTTPAATATQAITVTVTNVNEAPTFASATATAVVVENAAITTPVFTASATDPDAGTTLIYSIAGADAAAFTINSATGAVSLRAPADFETKSSYTFTVSASDAATGGLSTVTPQTVTLNVTNVNEAPTFAAATRTVSVAEDTTAVFAAGGATDPENGTITYTLTGADAALFNVAANGAVTFRTAPDFEAVPTKNTYSFNLVATDGVTPTTQAVTVNVTDVVEGPAATTVSLDTAATVTVSGLAAGGVAQATIFTDAAGLPSNATINNFGSDDIVRFTGATSVSFSSIDNDLLIEFLSGVNVNQIRINDIVSPNAIITNEANAEAAVNAFFGTTGGDYFRFA